MLSKILSLVLLTFTSITNSSNYFEQSNFASLSGQGDTFEFFENGYEEGQGFVYSTDVLFKDGQAAGLVFGGIKDEEAYVFNVDRFENRVKLLHFVKEENWVATEIENAPFIGNDKTTDGEYSLINPKVRTLDKIHLKVIVSYEKDIPYVECYADNIVRFNIDDPIKLSSYNGGLLGINVFNASVELNNTEIGKSDYSYYTELYRNQYHFSQFAHWNNDPNGLFYYNGYYHMYYQTHPYSQYWSDMYWGHARSKDLLHWQLLPICLFPDTEGKFGLGDGYMWSGSAMVYHPGMSDLIDSYNWFPNGNGEGIIAYYTRDGGHQDQVLMSSDDEGMTWTKRVHIPQSVCIPGDKRDLRDPELFPVKKEGDKVTMWGMILSSVNTQKCYFLKSTDLVNWQAAGSFYMHYPECISIIEKEDKNGVMRQIMMFTSRYYIVGNITYNETKGEIDFIDLDGNSLSSYSVDTLPLVTMDFAPDSYANQVFYIDDENSEYYGEDVSINWFSGVPNDRASAESGMFAQVRTNWNGSGMTIPVILDLNDDNVLTQTPITKDNENLNKNKIIDINNLEVTKESENILEDVNTHIFEAIVDIENERQADISIRINIGQNEYTEIGWNKEDGYYVDRTHTSSAGIAFNNHGFDNYHCKYSSNIGKNDTNLDFYILSDNGGLEVFAKDFSVPFFVLTLASPYSIGASFNVDDTVIVNQFVLNEIGTTWREDINTDEGVLYISNDDVYLDTTLTSEKEISVYYTGNGQINYEVVEGSDVIEVNSTPNGVRVSSLKEGSGLVCVTVSNKTKYINVTVKTGSPEIDISLNNSSIISGDWIMSNEGLIGSANGDGFIISDTEGVDFIYSARINSSSATAAAIVFRADKDLSSYLVANYDKASSMVKLWSHKGVISETHVEIDASDFVISVEANNKNVIVNINSFKAIDVTLDENMPLSGYFGLNVYNGKAIFNDIVLTSNTYVYEGGDFELELNTEQSILSVYNVTNKNTLIHEDYYRVEGKMLIIDESYFHLINEKGIYTLKIEGSLSVTTINVDIKFIPTLDFEDRILESGSNLVIYIGHLNIESVKVNGVNLDNDKYQVKDHMLTIYADNLIVGENIIKINDSIEINVNVLSLPTITDSEDSRSDMIIQDHILITASIILPILVIILIVTLLLKRRNNYGR